MTPADLLRMAVVASVKAHGYVQLVATGRSKRVRARDLMHAEVMKGLHGRVINEIKRPEGWSVVYDVRVDAIAKWCKAQMPAIEYDAACSEGFWDVVREAGMAELVADIHTAQSGPTCHAKLTLAGKRAVINGFSPYAMNHAVGAALIKAATDHMQEVPWCLVMAQAFADSEAPQPQGAPR